MIEPERNDMERNDMERNDMERNDMEMDDTEMNDAYMEMSKNSRHQQYQYLTCTSRQSP